MRHVGIVGSPSPFREMQSLVRTVPGTLARIDPLTDPRYDEFVAGCDGASAYHTGAWARILASAYGARPGYLGLTAPDGSLDAVLPLMASRGFVSGPRPRSLPVVPHAGPVGTSVESEVALVAEACRVADERGATLTVNSRAPGYDEYVPGLRTSSRNPSWITTFPADPATLRSGWKKSSNNLFRNIAKSE